MSSKDQTMSCHFFILHFEVFLGQILKRTEREGESLEGTEGTLGWSCGLNGDFSSSICQLTPYHPSRPSLPPPTFQILPQVTCDLRVVHGGVGCSVQTESRGGGVEMCRASGLSAGHSRYKETRQKEKKINNSLKFKEFFLSLVIGDSKCGCYAGALPLALAQKCHTEPGELFFFFFYQ